MRATGLEPCGKRGLQLNGTTKTFILASCFFLASVFATGQGNADVDVTVQAAEGSSVFLDGSLVGHTAAGELILSEVAAGEHTLLVTHPDSLPQSRTFTLDGSPLTIQFGESAALPPQAVKYDRRAGRDVESDWEPSMGWALVGVLVFFVATIVVSSVLFKSAER